MYNTSMQKRQVVVIAGPSGSGETTFTNELILAYPNFVRMVSATTRKPRLGERDGVDYYFMNDQEFFEAVQAHLIPEYIFIKERNVYYGTYLPDLEKKLSEGKTIIVNTDLSGARYYKRHFHAVTIFIRPKSLDVLRDRFKRRDPHISEKEIELRLKQAYQEIVDAKDNYDHMVFNTDGEFSDTIMHVVEILKKEGYQV